MEREREMRSERKRNGTREKRRDGVERERGGWGGVKWYGGRKEREK